MNRNAASDFFNSSRQNILAAQVCSAWLFICFLFFFFFKCIILSFNQFYIFLPNICCSLEMMLTTLLAACRFWQRGMITVNTPAGLLLLLIAGTKLPLISIARNLLNMKDSFCSVSEVFSQNEGKTQKQAVYQHHPFQQMTVQRSWNERLFNCIVSSHFGGICLCLTSWLFRVLIKGLIQRLFRTSAVCIPEV